jgi:hypothetical protein
VGRLGKEGKVGEGGEHVGVDVEVVLRMGKQWSFWRRCFIFACIGTVDEGSLNVWNVKLGGEA